MKEIKKKIAEILMLDDNHLETGDKTTSDLIETFDEFDYEEIYSDIYVLVHNIDDFYGEVSTPKAALLLESFLLESMVLLKKDPEVIVVESGDDFLRATSFTPDGESVMHVLENVVLINTMIELYNEALTELEVPVIDAGIGMAAFPKMEMEKHAHTEESEEEHDHDHDLDYAIDFNETAMLLAEYANSEELEPIVINDMAYEMLKEIDKEFITGHLERALRPIEEIIVYHGNIIADEN
ncbi:MAG: hypothetical protein JXB20_05910 [Bacilli bacterium]|nr:hypothetical protein [Bacilli bacterium]MBN2696330.1 hypothetical protein [Bacilli bacterium]